MKDQTFEHESFGMVGFHRVNGCVKNLFGSSVKNHNSTVQLKISRAERNHHLYSDWFFKKGTQIITVELSSSQFAELLTTMNMGDGVPCTIRDIDGKIMQNPPNDETETELIEKDFERTVKDVVIDLKLLRNQAKAIFEKKTITKDDKETILKNIDKVAQDITLSMPFVLESFNESTRRVITSVKAEIDSWVTHVATITGLEALKKMQTNLSLSEEIVVEVEPKQLKE